MSVIDVIDPDANGGRSCIVLRGPPPRADFPATAGPIAVHERLASLYLLVASAWTDRGREHVGFVLKARYALERDAGLMRQVDTAFSSNVHFSDWCHGGTVPEGLVAWRRYQPIRNQPVTVYLVRWDNPQPRVGVEEIEFTSPGNCVPIVIAVTGVRWDPASK